MYKKSLTIDTKTFESLTFAPLEKSLLILYTMTKLY